MGGTACKAKVILNGGAVQDLAQRLCYQVAGTPDESLSYEQWTNVVTHLNAAEESVSKAQRVYLEALGFNGPWPKAMKS